MTWACHRAVDIVSTSERMSLRRGCGIDSESEQLDTVAASQKVALRTRQCEKNGGLSYSSCHYCNLVYCTSTSVCAERSLCLGLIAVP